MCRQCEDCAHARYSRGHCRGVMDCDPDEYWCDVDNIYYYEDDDEIIKELRAEFIAEKMKNGMDEEQAEILADDEDFEVNCEDYCYGGDPYDEPDDNADYYYDMWRDEQYEMKDEG